MPTTRRIVLAGFTALTGTAPLASAGPAEAQTPLAESAVLMTEEGTLVFVGMSQQAWSDAFASRGRWWRYRMARRTGNAEIMAEAERGAREADAKLADLLRTEGYREVEIAGLLHRHQYDETADPVIDA